MSVRARRPRCPVMAVARVGTPGFETHPEAGGGAVQEGSVRDSEER